MPLTAHSALSKDRSNAKAVNVMQHRHFAVIAGIIAKIHPRMRSEIAWHFAGELRSTNPRFDQDRFLAACNVRNPQDVLADIERDLARD
jgi:hypothetical protein